MNDEILSGELARICGVSPDTIRHYERVGVLPAAVRGANGYRRFPSAAVDRVRLIRRALAIGFSLAELERILRQRDHGSAPCHSVRALAGEKLRALDRRIAEMTAMREELVTILAEWDERLAATRSGDPAHLLEIRSLRSTGTAEEESDTRLPSDSFAERSRHPQPSRKRGTT